MTQPRQTKPDPSTPSHLWELASLDLLQEAQAPDGSKWAVTLLVEGESGNRRWYSREALKKGYRLFEGAWVNADHFTEDERTARPEGSVTRRVGKITDVRLKEEGGKLAMVGTFNVIAPWVSESLMRAHKLGITDWAGFSIDAHGRMENRMIEGVGRTMPTVTELVRANSVDLVTIPAAGGAVHHAVESQGACSCSSSADPCKCGLTEGVTRMDEKEIKALVESAMAGMQASLVEAVSTAASTAAKDAVHQLLEAGEADDDEEDDEEDDDYEEDYDDDVDGDDGQGDLVGELEMAVTEVRRLRETAAAELKKLQAHATDTRITEAMSRLPGVPEPLAKLTRDRLTEAARTGRFDDGVVERVLESTRDTWAALAQTNPAGTSAMGGLAVVGRSEKYVHMLEGMFTGADVEGQPRFSGLKEAYCSFTGRNPLRLHPVEIFRALGSRYDAGFHHDNATGRLTESMTTASWGDIFADVLHNRMMAAYRAHPQYDQWRELVSTFDDTPDFQSQNITRWGGYANLPIVAEDAAYQPLSSPADERTSFVVAKRGGTEQITFEMVVNDDKGAIADIPNRIGYAAVRSLYEFVMDMVTVDNPTLAYDSVALYHDASHSNDGVNPLTVAGFDAAELAMMAQVPYGHPSNEVLGPRGEVAMVIVSRAQRLRARALFNPSSKMVASIAAAGAFSDVDLGAFADRGIKVLEYDGLSGLGWYGCTNPKLPGNNNLTVGFLGGRQTPELWVQDSPTEGEVFSNDRIKFRIRFIYGGVIPDHRMWFRQTP